MDGSATGQSTFMSSVLWLAVGYITERLPTRDMGFSRHTVKANDDLDYGDDVSLLSRSHKQLQKYSKTS